MAKYRELQRITTPPLIPFFPIIKKDLTFLYDGNETQVDGLVNFEKLRRLSQQIRVIKKYCQHTIMVRERRERRERREGERGGEGGREGERGGEGGREGEEGGRGGRERREW